MLLTGIFIIAASSLGPALFKKMVKRENLRQSARYDREWYEDMNS